MLNYTFSTHSLNSQIKHLCENTGHKFSHEDVRIGPGAGQHAHPSFYAVPLNFFDTAMQEFYFAKEFD